MIDEKLARELYRPIAPATSEPPPATANKIPIHRFQELEQKIKNNPANSEPYEELAGIYIEQQRWRDARRVLELGTHHNPENENLLSMFEDTRLRLARDAMDVAASKYRSQNSDAFLRELDQTELELAALQFEVAEARLTRHPQMSDLLITSAIALKRLGRMDEAIERLRRAQNFPASRAVASLNLGLCLESRSQVIEALTAYRCAALYRTPMPPREVKQRALELALALSERHLLFDSALRYVDLLLEDASETRQSLLNKRDELTKLAASQKRAKSDSSETLEAP